MPFAFSLDASSIVNEDFHELIWRNRFIIRAKSLAPMRKQKGTFVILQNCEEEFNNYHKSALKFYENGYDVIFVRLADSSCDLLRKKAFSQNLVERPAALPIIRRAEQINYIFRYLAYPDFRAPFYLLAQGTNALAALIAQSYLSDNVKMLVLVSPVLSWLGYDEKSSFALKCHFMASLGLGGCKPKNLSKRFQKEYNIYDHDSFDRLPNYAILNDIFRSVKLLNSKYFLEKATRPTLFFTKEKTAFQEDKFIKNYSGKLPLSNIITLRSKNNKNFDENVRLQRQFYAALEAFL